MGLQVWHPIDRGKLRGSLGAVEIPKLGPVCPDDANARMVTWYEANAEAIRSTRPDMISTARISIEHVLCRAESTILTKLGG